MKKIIGLVLSLTIISAVCAAVLAAVNAVTKDPIEKMTVQKTLDAAKAVMPDGVAAVEPIALKDGKKGYVGKDAAGKTLGYAAEGGDPKGYGGNIVLMVGFKADKKTLVRYKTLLAKETPGLGMKLNAPEFANQFVGKDATALKLKKKGGDIEAITAATITSSAVCRALADAQKAL